MEMETEDDVAVEGNADPTSSGMALVMVDEFQPEMVEIAPGGNEELTASS